jgi:hypothetical protein
MIELIEKSGIDSELLVLLLLLPIAVTIIGIFRHIIGFRSLGIYLSLLMTFLLYELGTNGTNVYSDFGQGLKYGLGLFLLVFSSTLFAYTITKKWALHYYPKLGIIITIVTSLLLLVFLILGSLNMKGIFNINLFTLILIVGLSEKYISILVRKKIKPTLMIALESVLQAVICFAIISYAPFISFILLYPYLIILLFPINYIIGRFAGLRLTEFQRFRKILNEIE